MKYHECGLGLYAMSKAAWVRLYGIYIGRSVYLKLHEYPVGRVMAGFTLSLIPHESHQYVVDAADAWCRCAMNDLEVELTIYPFPLR